MNFVTLIIFILAIKETWQLPVYVGQWSYDQDKWTITIHQMSNNNKYAIILTLWGLIPDHDKLSDD